ncbi:unnamed protein product [Blepharisma stoltei]|uniref:Methyltransferase domain-containing protein n=1 Tax=Blepharisma stoltei TaxID=1481888 RepID=A0AAU9JAL9_9CILI|nr:unnamed protein product [Blepharisma stoltei]
MESVYDANHAIYNEQLKSGRRYYCEEYNVIKELALNREFSDNCLENMRILDLGCGSGEFVAHMIQKGAQTAIGIDISQKMIDDANNLLSSQPQLSSRFSFAKANCFSIENVQEILPLEKYAGYFDAITSIFLLCYAQSERELNDLFCLCNKYLKENGTFAFITTNPRIALEFPEYQEKTKTGGFRLLSLQENNGLPLLEGGFCDIDTNELRFTVSNIIYSRAQIQSASEQNGFEIETTFYPAFHPDFDITSLSTRISIDFLNGNDSISFFFKAKKVRSL